MPSNMQRPTALEDTVRITIHIEENEIEYQVYDHGQGCSIWKNRAVT